MSSYDTIVGRVRLELTLFLMSGFYRPLPSPLTKLYRDGGIDAVIALKRNANSDNARRKMDGRAEARIIEVANIISI